jgi:PKHD-type hydroxylase
LWWSDNLTEFDTNLSVEDIQKQCDSIILQDGVVGSSQKPSEMRSSKVGFLTRDKSKDLFDLMWRLALARNKSAFGFDIESVENIQYGIYNENDKYDWHIDTNWSNPDSVYHRKISVAIQLSSPDEYEGGDFEIESEEWNDWDWTNRVKEKGTVIVFPSFLRHRVTPVTKGTRKSLIAWVDGLPFR